MFLQLLCLFPFISGVLMGGVSLICMDELRHPEASCYRPEQQPPSHATTHTATPPATGLPWSDETRRRVLAPIRLPLGCPLIPGTALRHAAAARCWERCQPCAGGSRMSVLQGLAPLHPRQSVQALCKWVHCSLIGIITSCNVF